MDVVILAAGLGSRLKDLTQDCPKAMVKVLNKPLIDYTLDMIDFSQINNVYVIGGYKIEVLKNHLEQKKIKKIKVIENKDYQAGSTLTVEKALPFIEDNFLLMNVDHIYSPEFFKRILKASNPDKIIAMSDSDRVLVADDMKIELSSNNTIKKISKQLSVFQKGYIGMSFIGKNQLQTYKKAVETVKNQTQSKANVEAVLDYLAPQIGIEVLDLSGIGWYEVDNQEDLTNAEKGLLKK